MDARSANRRWQDWLVALLGIWLLLSPWLLRFYAELPAQSWNFLAVGAAFIVFAAAALNLRTLWEEWVTLALGVWLIVSPWALAYSANASARDDAVVVGLVVGVLSIWSLLAKHAPAAAPELEHHAR